MKLECSKCAKYRFKKTDMLWLKTIKGRDYLLCEYHLEQENHRENRDTKPEKA